MAAFIGKLKGGEDTVVKKKRPDRGTVRSYLLKTKETLNEGFHLQEAVKK